MPSAVQRGRHRTHYQPAGVSAGDVTAEERVSTQDDVILLQSPLLFSHLLSNTRSLRLCLLHTWAARLRETVLEDRRTFLQSGNSAMM